MVAVPAATERITQLSTVATDGRFDVQVNVGTDPAGGLFSVVSSANDCATPSDKVEGQTTTRVVEPPTIGPVEAVSSQPRATAKTKNQSFFTVLLKTGV